MLGFKRELVERLQEEVHGREDFLENNDFGPEHELLRTMHLMDLNRVRYVLRAYLRTRLLKIEGNALQIVSSGLMDMLSAKEKAHVEEYTNTIGEFFDSSVLESRFSTAPEPGSVDAGGARTLSVDDPLLELDT